LIAAKPGRGIWLSENITNQAKIGFAYLKTILAKGKGPRTFRPAHALIIRSFVESIVGNRELLVTPEMAYEHVRITEQICRQIDRAL